MFYRSNQLCPVCEQLMEYDILGADELAKPVYYCDECDSEGSYGFDSDDAYEQMIDEVA